MRILAVFSEFPYPLTNGQNLRLYYYARQLAQSHTLDLVHLGRAPNDTGGSERSFREIVGVESDPQHKPACAGRPWDAFDPNRVFTIYPGLSRAVRALQTRWAHDVIWVGGGRLLPSLASILSAPVMLDECDHDGLALRREIGSESSLWRRLRLRKRYFVQRAFERRYFGRVDHVLLVAEPDYRSFRRDHPAIPASVIPNGVDAEYFSPIPDIPREPGHILFEGNMAFPPNADAALHLARNVLPVVRQTYPEAHLSLVGKDPPPAVRALGSADVRVTGFVEDVRPYYARASVFASPMRLGTGLKNKFLQAWAMGLPVITTPCAAEGVPQHSLRNLRLAPLSAFPGELSRLIRDEPALKALAAEGRKSALRLEWRSSALQLESLLCDVARGL